MLTADSWPFFHSKQPQEGIMAGATFNCSWQRGDAKITALMNIRQGTASGYLDAAPPHWFPCRVKTTLSPWQVAGLSPPTARQPDRRAPLSWPRFRTSPSLAGAGEIPDCGETHRQRGRAGKNSREAGWGGVFVKWTKPSSCDGVAARN